MQQIPNWKHPSVHIKCTHKATVVNSTREHCWSDCGDSQMKSLLRVGVSWDQDQLVAHREFVGESREDQLLHRGLSTCTIYSLNSVFCCQSIPVSAAERELSKEILNSSQFSWGFLKPFFKFHNFTTLKFSGSRFNFSLFLEINPSPPIHRNVTCTSFSRQTLHL